MLMNRCAISIVPRWPASLHSVHNDASEAFGGYPSLIKEGLSMHDADDDHSKATLSEPFPNRLWRKALRPPSAS